MSKYTKQVLPIIVENFNLKNFTNKFEEITDFIKKVEVVATVDEKVRIQVFYSYSFIHLN